MPWQERSLVDSRVRFAVEWEKDEIPFAELCRRYGISRKTGYKWIDRFLVDGVAGLDERTSRPLGNARATPKHIVDGLVEMKRQAPLLSERLTKSCRWCRTGRCRQ